MTSEVLARADLALETEDLLKVLGRHVGDGAVLGHRLEYGTLTLHIAPDRWVDVVAALRDEPLLSFDLFDSLFGVDDRDDGFRVVCVLYSTAMGVRVLLDVKVPGGREAPALGTLTGLYAGANWMERETWDMFGIEFEGHPRLAPRILNVENFEGWPLRKDFFLASRVAKPWPGVKEPAETDEEGNVIERETGLGDAPGPTDLDKAMADHAKAVNVTAAPAAPEEIEEPAAEEPTEEPEARAEPEAPAEEPVEEVAEEPVEEVAEEPVEETAEEPDEEPVEEVADEPAAEEPAATPKAGETSSPGDDVYEGELPDTPPEDDPSSAERDGWAE